MMPPNDTSSLWFCEAGNSLHDPPLQQIDSGWVCEAQYNLRTTPVQQIGNGRVSCTALQRTQRPCHYKTSRQSKVVDDHAAHRTACPDARLHTLCIQTPHSPTRICEGFAKTSPAPCRNLPRNTRHHTKTRNQICTRQPQHLEPIQQRPHHTMR